MTIKKQKAYYIIFVSPWFWIWTLKSSFFLFHLLQVKEHFPPASFFPPLLHLETTPVLSVLLNALRRRLLSSSLALVVTADKKLRSLISPRVLRGTPNKVHCLCLSLRLSCIPGTVTA